MNSPAKSHEVDSQKLRNVLDTISSQLKVPYMERRYRHNAHKNNPLEELQDAINDICEKERELTAAVGIAKMLLDNNDNLQSKSNKLKEQVGYFSEENRLLREEIQNYKNLVLKGENKYEKVSETLVKTETELMKLNVERQRGDMSRKDSDEGLLDNESFEKEMNDVRDYYQGEMEKRQSNFYLETIGELERKYNRLLTEKDKLEQNYTNLKALNEKFMAKQKKTSEKLKDVEKMNKILMEAKEKSDKKLKQMSLNYAKMLEKAECLEEELKLAESQQKTKASINESVQESNSLLTELQNIDSSVSHETSNLKLCIDDPDDEQFFQRSPERRYSYTPNSTPAAKCFFPCQSHFQITFYSSICIPSSKEIRRDPSEEYFTLATQAVKLNSPHMDTICVIPHVILYEKAKKEQVPFHKWHSWIETQLNYEYIQSLYRRKPNKLENFRRFLKRF